MAIQYTNRAKLPHPQGSDAVVVHSDLEALAEAADGAFAMYRSGTRAERPSAPFVDGRIYRQTNSAAGYPPGTLWIDNGTGWTLLFDPNGTHGTPTGVMVDFAGTEAQVPVGWVACDGRAVTAATAPLLRDFLVAAGSPYGVAGEDPRAPDFRGRTSVGLDSMGSTQGDAGRLDVPNTLGGSGGSQYHTLSSSEMPSHSHPISISSAGTGIAASTSSDGGHAHGMSDAGSHTHGIHWVGDHAHSASSSTNGAHGHTGGTMFAKHGGNINNRSLASGGSTNVALYGGGAFADASLNGDHAHAIYIGAAGGHSHGMDAAGSHSHTVTGSGGHSHTIAIADPQHSHGAAASNTGGGNAHNNMQPYLLVRKIIKA